MVFVTRLLVEYFQLIIAKLLPASCRLSPLSTTFLPPFLPSLFPFSVLCFTYAQFFQPVSVVVLERGGASVSPLWVKWCLDVHFKQVNLLSVIAKRVRLWSERVGATTHSQYVNFVKNPYQVYLHISNGIKWNNQQVRFTDHMLNKPNEKIKKGIYLKTESNVTWKLFCMNKITKRMDGQTEYDYMEYETGNKDWLTKILLNTF